MIGRASRKIFARRRIKAVLLMVVDAFQHVLARTWFRLEDVADEIAWADEQVDPPPLGDES